jgi:hypothetical protein
VDLKKICLGKNEERTEEGGLGEAISRKWGDLTKYEFGSNNLLSLDEGQYSVNFDGSLIFTASEDNTINGPAS